MNPLDLSLEPLRVTYEHLLLRAERVRQRIPSAAVLATDVGRGRLAVELAELRVAVLEAPTFGGPGMVRALNKEARDLCARIDTVLHRIDEESNPVKLHRDAAAVLEAARKFALGRIDATRDAA